MTADAPALRGFLAGARRTVGQAHVLTDPSVTESYRVDWTRRWRGHTDAVLRPAEAGEVAALVALAREHGIALVPQGGNTGLVGGGVPLQGEVIVSLRRLTDLGPVDPLAGQMTVGAGVPLAAAQAHAAAEGLAVAVDLGARDSATIGGMVATNAGGVHVVRHGPMRAQVVGVEAVLGTGALVRRLAGLVKDNTGYDLAQLLCGSEGTLGIVTTARLRLVPVPEHVTTAVIGLASTGGAVALAADLRTRVPDVAALEVMVGESLRTVARHLGVPPPVAPDAGAFLLVEVAGPADSTEALARTLAGRSGDAGVLETAVATNSRDRSRLWRFREGHPEAAAAGGVVHKLDVSLPPGEIAGFCDQVTDRIVTLFPGAMTLLYGHVGDGNIHVNVVGPAADDATVDDAVLDLVLGRGGSISAEHGIGVAKKAWLARDRSAAEIEAMRAIKRALDPDTILNPNVLLPWAG